jgi:flagellar motor switch/type III secretory pathway protein FliN
VSESRLGALSGPEKAAVLLLSFSSAQSAELISRLSRREAELLAGQLARAREADSGTRRRVLDDFRRAADAAGSPQTHRPAHSASADEPAEPGAAKEPVPERGAAQQAADGGVRPYDLGRLERVPRSALAKRAPALEADLSGLGSLPVRCRARLASLRLSLADLQHLAEGDVLLLGPAAEPTAELAAGDRCRLTCRLVRRGQRRAVMLLPAPELRRGVELPPLAAEGESP